MSRSLLFGYLARLLHTARYCNQHHISTEQGLEQLNAIKSATIAHHNQSQSKVKDIFDIAFPELKPKGESVNPSVTIIGAGIAGLVCGYELKQSGIRATLYEADSRVGGRCRSLRNYFPNQIVEGGGEFIDSRHKTMLNYIRKFRLGAESVAPQMGETIYYFDGHRYSEEAILSEFREFLKLIHEDGRKLSRMPRADQHTDTDRVFDRINLLEYLNLRQAGSLVKSFIETSYGVEYGLELQAQSCLNLLLLHRASKAYNPGLLHVFSDERYQVIGGNDQITERFKAELQNQIRLQMQLVRIRRNSAHRFELTFAQDLQTISVESDIVILAIPFSVLRHVELDQSLNLPPWKLEAIQHLGYGTSAKLMLGLQGRPWVHLGSNGHSYSNLAKHQVTWEMNPTQATARQAVIVNCFDGNRITVFTPQQMQAEATDFLEDLNCIYPGAATFASQTHDSKLMVKLEHWSSNPLSRGSYACYKPGQFTSILGNESKPIDNLYFIGEHTHSFYQWQGFMEGAAHSGFQAAHRVLKQLR
jgi:monoamine oxidase